MTIRSVYAVNKPVGPSSNQFLTEIRRHLHIKKIGHAGTLDPLASGVLVIGIGREGTKQLSGIVLTEKEYVATIELGRVSSTDDAEGLFSEPKTVFDPKTVFEDEVLDTLKPFVGHILQTPPQFSAIKIKGTRAYKTARSGHTVTLEPRPVDIHQIEVLEYKWPLLVIRVVCGKGVYIRALARDIGRELGVGGYLKALTRTRVGEGTLENCSTIEELISVNKSLDPGSNPG